MARGRPLNPLELSSQVREELESLVRSRSLPAALVRRATIVLRCADGLDNQSVAEKVGTSRQTVGKWRERFRKQGLMGLYDERKPGRPRSIEDDRIMELLEPLPGLLARPGELLGVLHLGPGCRELLLDRRSSEGRSSPA